MARPKGLRLHRPTLDLILNYVLRISMTEAADRCGLSLTTLSGLAHGDHGASLTTVRKIEDGIGFSEALFPELLGGFVARSSAIAA